LQLERSLAILPHRPAHPFFDVLLHIYGPHLRSLFAHPEPDLSRTALAAKNLALRQQLSVLNRKIHRLQLRRQDRFNLYCFVVLLHDRRQVIHFNVTRYPGEKLAISMRDRSVGEGQGHRNPASRRVASSLPTSPIMSAIRLAPG
jgi:hypothetical protein